MLNQLQQKTPEAGAGVYMSHQTYFTRRILPTALLHLPILRHASSGLYDLHYLARSCLWANYRMHRTAVAHLYAGFDRQHVTLARFTNDKYGVYIVRCL